MDGPLAGAARLGCWAGGSGWSGWLGRVWLLPMGGSGRVWCVRVGRGGGGVPGSNGSLGAPARRVGCWLLAGWVWQLGLAVWLLGWLVWLVAPPALGVSCGQTRGSINPPNGSRSIGRASTASGSPSTDPQGSAVAGGTAWLPLGAAGSRERGGCGTRVKLFQGEPVGTGHQNPTERT